MESVSVSVEDEYKKSQNIGVHDSEKFKAVNPLFVGDTISETVSEHDADYASRVRFKCGRFVLTERYYVLLLFTLINYLLFGDQNLLAPNLSVIADEFNMTDDERDTYLGGYVSLGFFSIGGIVALTVGYLADSVNRKWVFAATVCVGELSCAATYFVQTGTIAQFWSGLWLTRAITGCALGGALPIQFSFIGDLFPENDRGKAVAFFSIANGSGAGSGQYLSNLMSPDWRSPFLIISLPTFILVAIFLTTTEEPKRGQSESVLQNQPEQVIENPHVINWSKLKLMLSTPTVFLAIIQGLPGSIPWGVVLAFLNDFFKEEKELSNLTAANILTVWGLTTALATIIGGYLADKFWKTNPLFLPLFAGVTTFIAPFPMVYIFRADVDKIGIIAYAAVIGPSGLCAGFAGTIIKSVVLQVTLPEVRGSAFALQSLLDELGKGLGPYIVSAIIRAAGSRENGLVISVFGWIPTALIYFLMMCFLKGDLAMNQEALKETYLGKTTEDGSPELSEVEAKKVTETI